MFDKINSLEEFYNSESDEEYKQRKYMEYKELLKIKELITSFSKSQLYNIDEAKKRKYICQQSCYEKNGPQIFNNNCDTSQLNECVKKCNSEMRDLKQFLKNVDKLVAIKNDTCYNSCRRLQIDELDLTKDEQHAQLINQLQCDWVCVNKIDRRYRDFWLRQKNAIIERYDGKQF